MGGAKAPAPARDPSSNLSHGRSTRPTFVPAPQCLYAPPAPPAPPARALSLSRLAPQGHRGCAPAPAAGRHVNPRADRAGLPRGPAPSSGRRRPASAVGLWPAPRPACRTVARRCRCLPAAEARQRRRPPGSHSGQDRAGLPRGPAPSSGRPPAACRWRRPPDSCQSTCGSRRPA